MKLTPPRPAAGPPRNRVFAGLACLLFTGCAVAFWDYPRITVPDADYINVGCNGNGPPKRVYYPFHGIFIAIELEPLLLGLHVPNHNQVQLDDTPVVVSGQTRHGPVELTLPLKAAGQHLIAGSRTVVYEFDQRHDQSWQPGQASPDAVEDRILRGSVHLPGMTINGEHYPPQDLPVTRASWNKAMSTTDGANCVAR